MVCAVYPCYGLSWGTPSVSISAWSLLCGAVFWWIISSQYYVLNQSFALPAVVQSSVGYQNPMAVLPPTGMIASTPAMFFFSARYAVDTFFFIGGYLVMSGMLKVSPIVFIITTKLAATCSLGSV